MNALLIARWFLNKNNFLNNVSDTENITNMKLQKLLYYAQGLSFKRYDKPLFNEKILAWQHGPVVREVYEQYKEFGSNGIEFKGNPKLKFDEKTEELLEEVYRLYGQYSAWKLRKMTYGEKPWVITKINEEISQNVIRDFFKKEVI